MKKKPGLLMASGGLDSTSMMYELADKKLLGAVCFVDYGQASAKHCLNLVRWHARRLGLCVHVLKVLGAPRHHDYGKKPTKLGVYKRGFRPSNEQFPPDAKGASGAKAFMYKEWSWVEGRNAMFFVRAGILAGELGYETVYTAFQFNSSYWKIKPSRRYRYDTGPEFVQAMNQLYKSGAFIEKVQIVAPYLDRQRDKLWIMRRGLRYGADLKRTHSCEFFPACGRCSQCQIKTETLESLA